MKCKLLTALDNSYSTDSWEYDRYAWHMPKSDCSSSLSNPQPAQHIPHCHRLRASIPLSVAPNAISQEFHWPLPTFISFPFSPISLHFPSSFSIDFSVLTIPSFIYIFLCRCSCHFNVFTN